MVVHTIVGSVGDVSIAMGMCPELGLLRVHACHFAHCCGIVRKHIEGTVKAETHTQDGDQSTGQDGQEHAIVVIGTLMEPPLVQQEENLDPVDLWLT